MFVGMEHSFSWHKLNSLLKKSLALPGDSEVRGYLGVGHAVFEATQGLAFQFAHKMSVAVVEGYSPFLNSVAVAFSRNGYNVQQISREDLKSEDWIESLKKDTLFVLSEVDHPLTGESLRSESMSQTLSEKKIFNISVSYSYHRYYSPEIFPYDIRILNASVRRAVSLLGTRVKTHALIADTIDWHDLSVDSFALEALLGPGSESKDRVIEFEKSSTAGFQAALTDGEPRIYDRAVVYWPDIDGFAVISELASLLEISLPPVGGPSPFETASLCRWESSDHGRLFSHFEPEVARGLVVFSAEMIDDKMKAALEDVVKTLRELQGI